MTFEEWWTVQEIKRGYLWTKQDVESAWNRGYQEAYADAWKAIEEGKQQAIAGEIQRVKNFRSLL